MYCGKYLYASVTLCNSNTSLNGISYFIIRYQLVGIAVFTDQYYQLFSLNNISYRATGALKCYYLIIDELLVRPSGLTYQLQEHKKICEKWQEEGRKTRATMIPIWPLHKPSKESASTCKGKRNWKHMNKGDMSFLIGFQTLQSITAK